MDINKTIADLERTIEENELIIEKAKATISAAKSKRKRLATVLNNAKEILNEVEGTKPEPHKIVRGDDESPESFMQRLKEAGLTEKEIC